MHRTHKREQYALRAVFELAKHKGREFIKISEIAKAQAIPLRFLEVILNNLKGSGLIVSKRGFYGGYALNRPPHKISVGDVFRYMQGQPDTRQCLACISTVDCPFQNTCAFLPMWTRAIDAIFKIYDETTLQDLLDDEKKLLETLSAR